MREKAQNFKNTQKRPQKVYKLKVQKTKKKTNKMEWITTINFEYKTKKTN